jgi:hypothetical protein
LIALVVLIVSVMPIVPIVARPEEFKTVRMSSGRRAPEGEASLRLLRIGFHGNLWVGWDGPPRRLVPDPPGEPWRRARWPRAPRLTPTYVRGRHRQLAGTVHDVGVDLLEKYLESKLGG